MKEFFFLIVCPLAGLFCALVGCPPMFSKEDEPDAYAEWLAKVADENTAHLRSIRPKFSEKREAA